MTEWLTLDDNGKIHKSLKNHVFLLLTCSVYEIIGLAKKSFLRTVPTYTRPNLEDNQWALGKKNTTCEV